MLDFGQEHTTTVAKKKTENPCLARLPVGRVLRIFATDFSRCGRVWWNPGV